MNITNPYEYMNQGEKPILKEVSALYQSSSSRGPKASVLKRRRASVNSLSMACCSYRL